MSQAGVWQAGCVGKSQHNQAGAQHEQLLTAMCMSSSANDCEASCTVQVQQMVADISKGRTEEERHCYAEGEACLVVPAIRHTIQLSLVNLKLSAHLHLTPNVCAAR